MFDRHDVRVAGGLRKEPHDHIERLVRVVQQHVFLLDRGEHIAFVVLHAFGHAGAERGPQQVGTLVQHKLAQVADTDQTVDVHDLFFGHMQLVHDQITQGGGGIVRDFQSYHFTAAAAFQGGLELAHQIFGFVLKL